MTEPAFPIWHVRARAHDDRVAWVAVVQSDRHPDGAEVDLPVAQAMADVADRAVGYARFDDTGTPVGLEVTPDAAPKAPPLWFVEVPEPEAQPLAAVNLMAFTGHAVAPGSLLDSRAARRAGVTSADQLASFRWYPESGFGDQIYVSPQWRRRTIGTALLAAAGTLSFARGWHRLWGSGQRTSDGQRMYESSRWQHMSEPQTHVLPPMTPVDDREEAGR